MGPWGAGLVRASERLRQRAFTVGKRKMKRIVTLSIGTAWLTAVLLSAGIASAQQQANVQTASQKNRAYDMSRETVLEGKVLLYTPASSVPPLGAHVTVQTAAGAVDVHVGNANRLAANHLSLSSGDSVRIVGENVTYGKSTQFLARIVQKGNQILEVRSTRGLPLGTAVKLGPRTEGGAL
jgi:hypothetical protein